MKPSRGPFSGVSPDRPLERCLRRCQKFLRQHNVDAHGGWLVGLSGGSDSLALWRLALAYAQQEKQSVEAAVIDHGLRPEAQLEAQRLYGWLRAQGQRCHVLHVRPGDPGQGPEGAARQRRHQALEWTRQTRGLRWLALGHSADDQAETTLMRALTGTGLRGLAAMRPASGTLLRPVLWARRELLSQLSAALPMQVVHDPHNRDPRFLRSRMRHELFPIIEASFGDTVAGLCGLAEDAAAAAEWAEHIVRALPEKKLISGVIALPRSALQVLHPWLRRQWLADVLRRHDRPQRRGRDSLQRFAQLIPGSRAFALDLHGARVEADAYEVRVLWQT